MTIVRNSGVAVYSPHDHWPTAETLLVSHLPLAATVARRYTQREQIDEQFFELLWSA